MPKMKTHKATAKRLKVTGGGKIMHKRACAAHLRAKKSGKRKRKFKVMCAVHKSDLKHYRELIGPGGEL